MKGDLLADRERTAASLQESRQALLSLNETLESRIEERTRALALDVETSSADVKKVKRLLGK